jgi:hypothetical protein
MARGRKPKWTDNGFKNGIQTYSLSSWKYFHDFAQEHFDNKNYVYRGQNNENWKLEPTLNRLLKRNSIANYDEKIEAHLENFKFSVRGRADFIKDIIENENELWAVGQHNFLNTPLLDFTFSPYVAAYFAFYEKQKESSHRVIFALSQYHITEESTDLELFKPMSGHNPRLLNQGGLFVKFKTKDDLEKAIVDYVIKTKEESLYIKLTKIRIPNSDREECLIALDKMNINHNSLFPDLFGASIYCNTKLEINKY